MNNNELSEFIKIAYERGKIRDVDNAFLEYPVEEEWHQGKIEYVLKEKSTDYNIYSIGDIVFVNKYSYSNGNMGENHFFVIIDQNNMAIPIENFGMLISSNLNKLKFDSNVLLKKDKTNRLDRNSIVKTDIIYKIYNEQILFKIGKVDIEKVEEYKRLFIKRIKK